MKIRVCIDRIVLDGLGWSASERRGFERSFVASLHATIALRADTCAPFRASNESGSEILSIEALDIRDPAGAAIAIAAPLANHAMSVPEAVGTTTSKEVGS